MPTTGLWEHIQLTFRSIKDFLWRQAEFERDIIRERMQAGPMLPALEGE
jgi:hypothetical protein